MRYFTAAITKLRGKIFSELNLKLSISKYVNETSKFGLPRPAIVINHVRVIGLFTDLEKASDRKAILIAIHEIWWIKSDNFDSSKYK